MPNYDLNEELNRLATDDTHVFGQGQLMRISSVIDDNMGPQFASELSFHVVEMKNVDGSIRNIPIIVKKQVADELRETFDTNAQFANEVNMYRTIMPRLGIHTLNVVPRFFYGRATDGKRPEEDILILEDLRHSGFKVPEDIFLDFDHISIALNKLGQFHGLSYNFKKTASDDFAALGRTLKNPNRKLKVEDVTGLTNGLARGFIELLENNPDDILLNRAYDRIAKGDIVMEWDRLKMPREPFAVIIHGDFNRNNLFYQYDLNGKVTDLKFLDFGTPLLGDPSVDIAFLLYMNTNQETRNKHWDQFLDTYWSGLTSVATEPGFSYEEFLNHFQKRAISGYFPCSFYLPMMLYFKLVMFSDKTTEERIKMCYSEHSEEGTEAVVNILLHAKEKGIMSAYLEDKD